MDPWLLGILIYLSGATFVGFFLYIQERYVRGSSFDRKAWADPSIFIFLFFIWHIGAFFMFPKELAQGIWYCITWLFKSHSLFLSADERKVNELRKRVKRAEAEYDRTQKKLQHAEGLSQEMINLMQQEQEIKDKTRALYDNSNEKFQNILTSDLSHSGVENEANSSQAPCNKLRVIGS